MGGGGGGGGCWGMWRGQRDFTDSLIRYHSMIIDILKGTKQELSFMYETNCHDQFCISVKYHENISEGIQAMEQTPKIIKGK